MRDARQACGASGAPSLANVNVTSSSGARISGCTGADGPAARAKPPSFRTMNDIWRAAANAVSLSASTTACGRQ